MKSLEDRYRISDLLFLLQDGILGILGIQQKVLNFEIDYIEIDYSFQEFGLCILGDFSFQVDKVFVIYQAS